MYWKKFFVPVLLLVALVLIGASCTKKPASVNFPEVCKEKELPDGFPTEYVYPDSLPMAAVDVGLGGETGGETYMQEGYVSSFCVEEDPDVVKDWYENKMAEKGFKHVYMEGETDLMWMDPSGQSVNVSAYPIPDAEDFTLYSFQIMTPDY